MRELFFRRFLQAGRHIWNAVIATMMKAVAAADWNRCGRCLADLIEPKPCVLRCLRIPDGKHFVFLKGRIQHCQKPAVFARSTDSCGWLKPPRVLFFGGGQKHRKGRDLKIVVGTPGGRRSRPSIRQETLSFQLVSCSGTV